MQTGTIHHAMRSACDVVASVFGVLLKRHVSKTVARPSVTCRHFGNAPKGKQVATHLVQ